MLTAKGCTASGSGARGCLEYRESLHLDTVLASKGRVCLGCRDRMPRALPCSSRVATALTVTLGPRQRRVRDVVEHPDNELADLFGPVIDTYTRS